MRVGLRAAVFCAGGVAFGWRDEVQRHVTRMRLGIRVVGHAVATIVVDGGAPTQGGTVVRRLGIRYRRRAHEIHIPQCGREIGKPNTIIAEVEVYARPTQCLTRWYRRGCIAFRRGTATPAGEVEVAARTQKH